MNEVVFVRNWMKINLISMKNRMMIDYIQLKYRKALISEKL